jgi:hypothetical protein
MPATPAFVERLLRALLMGCLGKPTHAPIYPVNGGRLAAQWTILANNRNLLSHNQEGAKAIDRIRVIERRACWREPKRCGARGVLRRSIADLRGVA